MTTLGQDVADALPELRREAESLMVDRVLVERSTGRRTDPATGKLVETWERVYAGPGRWLSRVDQTVVDQAGTQVTVDTRELRLPAASSEAVRPGMRVTTTSAVNDPALVGRVSVVVQDATGTQPVHRRVRCKEA